jgi:hypothetical protein
VEERRLTQEKEEDLEEEGDKEQEEAQDSLVEVLLFLWGTCVVMK